MQKIGPTADFNAGPDMTKKPIAADELEKMILQLLKDKPDCGDALAVSVEATEENPQAGNWRVISFSSGESSRDICEAALWEIEDALLPVYDLGR